MILAAVIVLYAFIAFSLPGSRYQGDDWGIVPAWLLACFGAILTLYFLSTHNWQEMPAKYAFLDTLGRGLQTPLPYVPGHRMNPNVVGGMLVMIIPFAAAVTWISVKDRDWLALVAALFLLSSTLFGLLLTTSRGAWMALGVASGMLFLWWLAGYFSRERPERRRFLFLVGLFLIIAILLVVIILRPDLPGRLVTNFAQLAGDVTRLELMRNSLALVQDYPFIGSGLNGFLMLYASYAFLTHVGYIVNAHNFYLDVAIEQGLFALLALIMMWTLFGLALWRKAYDGKLQPWLVAAALALVTMLAHGLVEDAFYGSRALMLLFTPLAFAMPYPRPAKVMSFTSSNFIAFSLTTVLLIILGLIYWRPLQSIAVSNLAAVRQSRAELSQYSWPEWPIQDALRSELDLTEVIEGYEKALTIYPDNVSANRRLGQIQLSLGEYRGALDHLETAYTDAMWDNTVRQLYGEALIVNDRLQEGSALWKQVNNQQGQLNYREFWYEYINDEKRLANIRAAMDS